MSVPSSGDAPQRSVEDLIFVGFNSRAVALDRNTGATVWIWKAPQGKGFAAVLLDGDRLIVSVQGYTYCLEPLSGQLLWGNPLSGQGVGVPCLASVRGNTYSGMYAMLAEQQETDEQTQHSAGS